MPTSKKPKFHVKKSQEVNLELKKLRSWGKVKQTIKFYYNKDHE